jgi:hypothetical protein
MRLIVALLALLALLLASCADSAIGQHAQGPDWPAQGSAADTWVVTRTASHGTAVLFTLSPAVRWRDGRLVRCAFFAVEHPDTELARLPRVRTYNFPALDSTEPVGGGAAEKCVTVSPRAGLTWGDVAGEKDVVLDFDSLEEHR